MPFVYIPEGVIDGGSNPISKIVSIYYEAWIVLVSFDVLTQTRFVLL